MQHPFIAQREESLLLIIDVQQAMSKVIANWHNTVHQIKKLTTAAKLWDIPILVTEQYKKGLGATIPELTTELDGAVFFPKEHFNACLEDNFVNTVHRFKRRKIVVAGVETHICVLQTGLDLIGNGYQLHVVENAISSRFDEDRNAGLNLLREAGAVMATAESIIFQWIRRANTEDFRDILPVVK